MNELEKDIIELANTVLQSFCDHAGTHKNGYVVIDNEPITLMTDGAIGVLMMLINKHKIEWEHLEQAQHLHDMIREHAKTITKEYKK